MDKVGKSLEGLKDTGRLLILSRDEFLHHRPSGSHHSSLSVSAATHVACTSLILQPMVEASYLTKSQTGLAIKEPGIVTVHRPGIMLLGLALSLTCPRQDRAVLINFRFTPTPLSESHS